MDTKVFLAVGVTVAVLIGVAAVFFASGDPDGLESTALVVQGDKTLTGDTPAGAEIHEETEGRFVYISPFPDYAIGPFSGATGSIIAIAGGTILAFASVWGMSLLISRRRTTNQ
ncbi:MAG: PDGLE domain-containing protein [Methanoregulaceae archaeon]|nr:PDGLE domain-containing protein [Methanoregulaceae archaeon]